MVKVKILTRNLFPGSDLPILENCIVVVLDAGIPAKDERIPFNSLDELIHQRVRVVDDLAGVLKKLIPVSAHW